MLEPEVLLEDTFEFKETPFLVRVKKEPVYINRRTGEIKRINTIGRPEGMSRVTRNWMKVPGAIVTLRPDYPYTVEKKWPPNVDKHFRICYAYEVPYKKGFLRGWGLQENEDIPDNAKEMAKEVISTMVEAYKNRTVVESLE